MAVRGPVAVRERRRTGERRAEALAGYGLIAVPMILFLVLNIGSVLYAVYISAWRWRALGPVRFLGLENYRMLLADPTFHRALRNSLYYTAVVVPSQMALGLALAVVVNSKIRGRTFFRAAYYFPALASSAAITVLFTFLLAPDGLLNAILSRLGLHPEGFLNKGNWLANSRSALESIMGLNVWTTSGTVMLFYLAALQTISQETYEAAAIDGANAWKSFWRITFPLLKPGHYFVAVVSVIGALQVFDQAYIIGGTNGDPNYATMTIVLYLYNAAIGRNQLGFAAAVGIVLFVLIFSLTLIQRRLFGEAPSWARERR